MTDYKRGYHSDAFENALNKENDLKNIRIKKALEFAGASKNDDIKSYLESAIKSLDLHTKTQKLFPSSSDKMAENFASDFMIELESKSGMYTGQNKEDDKPKFYKAFIRYVLESPDFDKSFKLKAIESIIEAPELKKDCIIKREDYKYSMLLDDKDLVQYINKEKDMLETSVKKESGLDAELDLKKLTLANQVGENNNYSNKRISIIYSNSGQLLVSKLKAAVKPIAVVPPTVASTAVVTHSAAPTADHTADHTALVTYSAAVVAEAEFVNIEQELCDKVATENGKLGIDVFSAVGLDSASFNQDSEVDDYNDGADKVLDGLNSNVKEDFDFVEWICYGSISQLYGMIF